MTSLEVEAQKRRDRLALLKAKKGSAVKSVSAGEDLLRPIDDFNDQPVENEPEAMEDDEPLVKK